MERVLTRLLTKSVPFTFNRYGYYYFSRRVPADLIQHYSYPRIDTVHFGVIMVFNLMIGLVTPPMGLVLYVVSDVSGEKFEGVVKDILPFYIPMLITLLLITAFPQLVLALPNLVFG